jgi:hypothetical protein
VFGGVRKMYCCNLRVSRVQNLTQRTLIWSFRKRQAQMGSEFQRLAVQTWDTLRYTGNRHSGTECCGVCLDNGESAMRSTASPHPHTGIIKSCRLIEMSFTSTSKQTFGSARARAGSQNLKFQRISLLPSRFGSVEPHFASWMS